MDEDTLREACQTGFEYISRRTRAANMINARLQRMYRDIPDMEQWQVALQLREVLGIEQ